MRQLLVRPAIYEYETCAPFVKDFEIGAGDLILTNEFIYQPFFGALNLEADVLYQERYGSGEPSDEMAEAIWADLQKPYKRIVGIGGGTVLDLAKLYALQEVSPIVDLFDRKLSPVKDKELILVPTTCGTGSEITNLSILEIKSRHTKMGYGADEIFADSVVMVPALLESLPYAVFATSSLDALIHAAESSVSPKANAYTKLFSFQAIEIILRGYREIAEKGMEARTALLGTFLRASNYAGIAFGNAGVGAVHAMSYPLGGKYHVPHGEANYALFLGVFRRYASISQTGAIAELHAVMSQALDCGVSDVYEVLGKLLEAILPRRPLREYGVLEADIPGFTTIVMEKQGRLTANNFVPLSAQDVTDIYMELR